MADGGGLRDEGTQWSALCSRTHYVPAKRHVNCRTWTTSSCDESFVFRSKPAEFQTASPSHHHYHQQPPPLMTPLNMSIFVTAHGPTGDDAPFIRFIESGTTRHTLSSIILIFQLSQILDDSASSSLVSAGSVFSELPTTSSVSPLSMKSFESSQSDDSQRSRSPSPLDRTSFYPKYYNPPTLVRPHIYKSTFASAQVSR